jgi:hypothetical protein
VCERERLHGRLRRKNQKDRDHWERPDVEDIIQIGYREIGWRCMVSITLS